MLTVRLAHPKPCLPSLLSLAHISAPQNRVIGHNSSFVVLGSDYQCQRHHSSHCWLGSDGVGSTTKRIGAASVWHAILPTSGNGSDHYLARTLFHRQEKRGEGSWNVAWDARPARWLHWPDSVWLLFGVCACLGVPQPHFPDITHDLVTVADNIDGSADDFDSKTPDISPNYSVTGVPADGRCLFRAIAHVACLRNGEEAPDENRQRELADKLRAQVVDELIKRRKEAEWFIEGDFDAYVKRIQQPYVWGGEPELLMASHVVKAPISVFMVDRSSGNLMNIANYGEEYQKDEVHSINVLFHGYGHYDILESIPDQSKGK